MNYKAVTTLKKADTEGRIPAYTLDQYVRTELCQKLMTAVKPRLLINRTEASHSTESATVQFATELILLKPEQWKQMKESLLHAVSHLSPEQQIAIQQLITEVDINC